MPFKKLPFEIIGDIFIIYWEMDEDPRTLLLVCHHWMDIAIRNHRLWTEFVLRTNVGYMVNRSARAIECRTWDGIRSVVKYAGNLPIRLVFDLDREVEGELWPAFSRDLLAKCSILELQSLPPNFVTSANLTFDALHTLLTRGNWGRPNLNQDLFVRAIASSAPLLSTIYLGYKTCGSLLSQAKTIILESGTGLSSEFGNQVPKLENFIAKGTCIHQHPRGFSLRHLTSMELIHSPQIPTLDCPALRNLKIVSANCEDDPFCQDISFTLPSLKSLTLGLCRAIPPIYAPDLASLRLYGGHDWMGAKLSSILPMDCDLRQLSVNVDISEKEVIKLLRTKWTELEELEWGQEVSNQSFITGSRLLAAIAGNDSNPLCPNLRRLSVTQFDTPLTKQEMLDAMDHARGIIEATLTERKTRQVRELEYIKYGFDYTPVRGERIWDYHYVC